MSVGSCICPNLVPVLNDIIDNLYVKTGTVQEKDSNIDGVSGIVTNLKRL